MQTYIINPMWFYWLQVIGESKSFFCAFGWGLVIYFVVLVLTWAICKSSYKNYPQISSGELKTYTALEKVFKPLLIVSITSIALSILIPSKETLLSMMVAKFATYENAQWTADAIKSTVDYIIEAFKAIG